MPIRKINNNMDYQNLTFGIILIIISFIYYFFEDRYINYLKKKSPDLDEQGMKIKIYIGIIFSFFIGIILILASFH